MKTIAFCVTSDLSTDQRILRHCKLLHDQGFRVILIGRSKADSPPLPAVPYSCKRWNMLFTKGPLFYFFYNLRLFFFLLSVKTNIIWSNDLDTVFPCFLVARLRKKILVFDAHELFTEVPELAHSSFKRTIWLWFEKHCASKADHFLTVNNSLARIFEKRYAVNPVVIRNVPEYHSVVPADREPYVQDPKTLVLVVQGSGLNHGRGLMESILAMETIQEALLLVIGSGTAVPEAKDYVQSHELEAKVTFIPRLPYLEMIQITAMADVGLAYDTHPCLNYHLALPNKIFDYFQAGVAVICAQQPEIKQLVSQYSCGIVMEDCSVESIRKAIIRFKENPAYLTACKQQSKGARLTEHWGVEQTKLLNLIEKLR